MDVPGLLDVQWLLSKDIQAITPMMMDRHSQQ